MKRYDLRHLQNDFYDRMGELIDSELKDGEVGIFLFEVGDFSSIQKSADFIRDRGDELMNSLKFNEVDWTLVMKKVSSANIAIAEEKVASSEKKDSTERETIAKKKAE